MNFYEIYKWGGEELGWFRCGEVDADNPGQAYNIARVWFGAKGVYSVRPAGVEALTHEHELSGAV